MPLRCVDEHGTTIDASTCDDEDWKALRARARAERHLRMPCCRTRAVLKTSRLGTRFFAHKAKGACTWKPETEVHRHLKKLALNAARNAGWEAQSEASGSTPDGERWIADVVAWRGREKIAVEIQWSGQTNDETLHRQQRYRRSGVKGVWLLRQPGLPISEELPATCIGGSLEEGLKILLPKREGGTAHQRKDDRHWSQSLEPEDFFKAVFEDRFLFGTGHVNSLTLSVVTNVFDCVRCGGRTRIVTGFKGRAGIVDLHYTLNLARANPELARRLQGAVKGREDIGPLRERYNRIDRQSYLVNACAQCDAGIGRIFDGTERFREGEIVGEIQWQLDAEAKNMLANSTQRWGVWEAGSWSE